MYLSTGNRIDEVDLNFSFFLNGNHAVCSYTTSLIIDIPKSNVIYFQVSYRKLLMVFVIKTYSFQCAHSNNILLNNSNIMFFGSVQM